VVLPDKRVKDPWTAIDTIIHESVHVYQKAMKYIEEQETSEEFEAYFMASIATNLLKDYKKRENL
jgi:hypothetical protein